MASITKRGSSYRIKVSCGYGVDGKQVVQTTTWKPETGMTEKQAEKEVNRQSILFEQECLKGNFKVTVKFEDFAKRWFVEYCERQMKGYTIYRYHNLAPQIYAELGHLRLDKITSRHIQSYVLKLADTKMRGDKTYLTSTVMKYFNMISSIFEYAIKMQLLTDNPCKKVYVPKKEAKEREVYSLKEAQTLLEKLEADSIENPKKYFRWFIYFTLAIYTGLRKGEVLGSEWNDIDLVSGMMKVSRASCYTPERGIYTDTPKTAQSIRTLKLPEEVIAKLKDFKSWQSKYAKELANKWQECGRIFTTWDGKPLSPNMPLYFFREYCDWNGLRRVTVHSFRHLNASLLISSGVDVKTVQACLGHSSASTTLDIYAHSFQAQQMRAMESVANAIQMKKPEKNQKSKKIT